MYGYICLVLSYGVPFCTFVLLFGLPSQTKTILCGLSVINWNQVTYKENLTNDINLFLNAKKTQMDVAPYDLFMNTFKIWQHFPFQIRASMFT